MLRGSAVVERRELELAVAGGVPPMLQRVAMIAAMGVPLVCMTVLRALRGGDVRVALLTSAVALVALAIGMGTSISRRIVGDVAERSDASYELDEVGVRVENASGSVRVDWSAVAGVYQSPSAFLLYVHGRSPLVLLTRAFHDLPSVRALLAEKTTPARFGPRRLLLFGCGMLFFFTSLAAVFFAVVARV
ncbi:MAG: YcxB family protein [Polyangiales bacterium]